jgi:hypothetical protein
VEHRHPHRHQDVGDRAVLGQAGMELGRLGGQDLGQAAELVEQLVDDRAGVRGAERFQQPL